MEPRPRGWLAGLESVEIKGLSSIAIPKRDKTAGAYESKYFQPSPSQEIVGISASLDIETKGLWGLMNDRLSVIQVSYFTITITKQLDKRT